MWANSYCTGRNVFGRCSREADEGEGNDVCVTGEVKVLGVRAGPEVEECWRVTVCVRGASASSGWVALPRQGGRLCPVRLSRFSPAGP